MVPLSELCGGSALISPQPLCEWKDWIQPLTFLGGFIVGAFGLFKAVSEMRESREQRAEELRWKRANAAKELLDDIHNHDLAKIAVHMMDWFERQAEYVLPSGKRETITYAEVLVALAKNHEEPVQPQEVYIRDCFDWFFYRLDRIEHYIRRGLIDFEDVKAVFHVYARDIAKNKDTYDAFLVFHEYDLARAFLKRYH
jgi:hypothetical protein